MCFLPDEYVCEVNKGQVNRISCKDRELILDFAKEQQNNLKNLQESMNVCAMKKVRNSET